MWIIRSRPGRRALGRRPVGEAPPPRNSGGREVFGPYSWPVVTTVHPLLEIKSRPQLRGQVVRHLGRSWVSNSFTDLNDRASHPSSARHPPRRALSVFAKLGLDHNASRNVPGRAERADAQKWERARIATADADRHRRRPLEHGKAESLDDRGALRATSSASNTRRLEINRPHPGGLAPSA